jgi:hypothetical protein
MGILSNLKPRHEGKPCKVGQILNELEPEDAHILATALGDYKAWSHRALTIALNDRGIAVTAETVRSHRTNVCACRRLA